MRNDIFLRKDKRFTLEEYIPLASHIMTQIAAAAEDVDEIKETFTISDLRQMLRDMTELMEGEFEFNETHSGHYQVVYEPYDDIDEEDFGREYVLPHLVEPPDGNLNDKKILFGITAKKFLKHSGNRYSLGRLSCSIFTLVSSCIVTSLSRYHIISSLRKL